SPPGTPGGEGPAVRGMAYAARTASSRASCRSRSGFSPGTSSCDSDREAPLVVRHDLTPGDPQLDRRHRFRLPTLEKSDGLTLAQDRPHLCCQRQAGKIGLLFHKPPIVFPSFFACPKE